MATLEARNLRKTYRTRTSAVEAVRGVSIRIEQGEILALLGPNGAGKTTTVKMIVGLVWPDHGEISILGRSPLRDWRALREVGALLEGSRNLYLRLTALENLVYFGMIRGLARGDARRRGLQLLELFGLEEKAGSLTHTLSRGMQQKLALAIALVHRPSLLLLDEPTLGLDLESTMAVKTLVRDAAKSGCAILLTTHQLDLAEEISDRVAIIHHGVILTEGHPRDLTARFAAGNWVIRLSGIPPAQHEVALRNLGATVEGLNVSYAGDVVGFWQVIDSLRPLEIVYLEKDHVNLSEAFLRLTRENHNAEAACR